ncbi:MAG: signal transduction histidine kinase with CheB and CheR [Segetibacter sp.]|nr:signal transduction histidine kinase with CheB and CheR [Segetibacter sp.]
MENEVVLKIGDNENTSRPFPIVAIGASAGGLEAIIELLNNLRQETGMAFVYIQHLDPTHKSALADILQRSTKMKVVEVRDQTPIKKDHLFIIPPNTNLSIVDGAFKLVERLKRPAKDAPIDCFFLSLAENQKEGAIGIILSGMASDGALGLKAIKMAGGLTFAQDGTAQFESMPKSAIAEGGVDAVLSPGEMAKELVRLSGRPSLLRTLLFAEPEGEDIKFAEAESTEIRKEDVIRILRIVKAKTGVDFTYYKQTTILRRIIRRVLLHKLENVAEYIEYLLKNSNEPNLLFQDLLINVTHFFRDPETVDCLKKELLPQLLKNRSRTNPLRIWIPGCSTGEEAYSLAMLILEELEGKIVNTPVQIFATDLSEIAISKARAGIYSTADVANISPERLNRFFTKTDGYYRVIKMIRDLCVYAPHNVIKDPPFSKIDLISCCNMLIYLDSTLQKKVFTNFHYALTEGGYLILGKSETAGASVELFTQAHKKAKIYTKNTNVAPKANIEVEVEKKAPKIIARTAVRDEKQSQPANIEKVIDYIFAEKYSPAGVVINHSLDIIHFRGAINQFLHPAPGKASLNLLKMIRRDLELEVRSATTDAIKKGEIVRRDDLEINDNGVIKHVAFEVTPLDNYTGEKLLLVVFEELKVYSPVETAATQSSDKRAKQLETELMLMREDVRGIIEEQEAANEELQSANEEIVSSNEELQSINEELETSKEELESSNEELLTINQELQVRNEQLSEAQEYTEAVIETIREAVLILDGELRVKSANKAFYRMFNCKELDTESKMIFELCQRRFDIPALRHFLREVLPERSQYNGFEIKHKFDGIGEKVLLLSARQLTQKIYGQRFILLAFEDITEHRIAEKLLEEREAWLRNMTNNVPVMIWVAGPDKNFNYLNKTWLAFTGRTLNKETGIGWTEGVHKHDIELVLTTYHKAFEERKPMEIEYRMKRRDGEYRWMLNSAVPTYDADGHFTGYTGTCTEVHDKRIIHQELEGLVKDRTFELQEANANLLRSNSELKQFAYVASHDLQEPLRKIITFANRFREKFIKDLPEQGKETIDKIAFSAERMRQLIYDLLNFTRISSVGKNFVTTDLNEIIKEVLTDFDLLIQEKKAVVNIGNLPVVRAIPLQMNQLFHNLVSNALKFAVEDPVLTIASRSIPKEEVLNHPDLQPNLDYFELVVKDNGIGFEQEFADQIFVIFQRLNDKEQFAGTGIGLALVKKIVLNHRGVIYATSKENEGAEFHIILPVQNV